MCPKNCSKKKKSLFPSKNKRWNKNKGRMLRCDFSSSFLIGFIGVTLVHKTGFKCTTQRNICTLHHASIAQSSPFPTPLSPTLPTSIYPPPRPLSLQLSPHCHLCLMSFQSPKLLTDLSLKFQTQVYVV